MSKTIFLNTLWGLCNRLIELAECLALAELTESRLLLRWTPGFDCPARFGELFEPVCDEFEGQPPFVCDLVIPPAFLMPNTFWRHYVVERSDIACVAFEALAIEWLRRLRPRPEIARRVEALIGAQEGRPLVGLHVRRTDLAADVALGIRKGCAVSSDRMFFERMERELIVDPDTTFFLATDNPASQAAFMSRFASKIVVATERFLDPVPNPRDHRPDQQRLTSMQDALIDLLCLARCHRIIGTPGSTFSIAAGWLGDIPVEPATKLTHRSAQAFRVKRPRSNDRRSS